MEKFNVNFLCWEHQSLWLTTRLSTCLEPEGRLQRNADFPLCVHDSEKLFDSFLDPHVSYLRTVLARYRCTPARDHWGSRVCISLYTSLAGRLLRVLSHLSIKPVHARLFPAQCCQTRSHFRDQMLRSMPPVSFQLQAGIVILEKKKNDWLTTNANSCHVDTLFCTKHVNTI